MKKLLILLVLVLSVVRPVDAKAYGSAEFIMIAFLSFVASEYDVLGIIKPEVNMPLDQEQIEEDENIALSVLLAALVCMESS